MQQPAELIALRGHCSDVLSACAFLRAQWPFIHHAPTMPPMMLLFQLYFLLPDRTAVDREIAALQSASRIRVLKLFASDEGHDLAIVLQDDYEAAIRAQMHTTQVQEESSSLTAKPTAIARPASLPVGSSSSAAAAAAASSASPAAPIKSRSSVVPAAPSSSSSSSPAAAAAAAASAPASVPTFAPWPSSRSSAVAAAAASLLPPKPPQPAKDRQPEVRRKRSQPTPGTANAAAASSAAAAASASAVLRSASVGSATAASSAAAAPVAAAAAHKRSKVSHSPPTAIVAAAAAASVVSSSSDPSAPVSSAGGAHSKLHVNLADTLSDDRFPALASAHPSHFVSADASTLLQLFLQHVVPAVRDVSLTLEQLSALVYAPHMHRFQSMTREQAVSCLLHMQVLLFKSATSFYLSVPGIGRLLSALRLGRKEVLSLLRKRTYKELPLRDLLAVSALKSSPCRIDFHLREMLGSEHLIHMEATTVGPMIKIRQASH